MRYSLSGSYSEDKPDVCFRLSALFGLISLRARFDKDLTLSAGIYLCGLRVRDLMKEPDEMPTEPPDEAPAKPGRDIKGIFCRIQSILKEPAFAAALPDIMKRVRAVLYAIRPRSGHITARVGLSDPAATARVCEAYIWLMPVLYDNVELIPDFNGEILDIKGLVRGRASLAVLIYQGLRILITGEKLWKKTKKRSGSSERALAST